MYKRKKLIGAKALILTCAALMAVAYNVNRKVSADDRTPVSFNRDIRPIFSDTCFRCHGPDKNARKAELRLDIREEATKKTKSGVIPIVPGKPEESEIVRRIFSNEDYEMMPPKESHAEPERENQTLGRRRREIRRPLGLQRAAPSRNTRPLELS